MNLFDLFIKIGVDDQASSKIGDLAGKLGNGLKTAAKVGAAAVGTATTAVAAVAKSAIENYAEYEQLVGGVETLFKNSSDRVQVYAQNAYKTAGLSANEYMETVTSFSASLLQSLDGDTIAAARYADKAVTDMADNANKMGTSMESIQNAYQGFAKQNYTMLDNLKLGYGGTKEEMARLIQDAAALSDTVDAQSMSFDNIVEAIHVVQDNLGITGTTAKEASSTIQGSVASMSAAWTNLLTGLSDQNADLDSLITNFVNSIGTVIQNVIPKISMVLLGVSKLIEDLVPVILEEIPPLITETLPQIVEAGINILKTLLGALTEDPDTIVETIMNLVDMLIDAIVDLLPEFIVTAALIIGKLAAGLIQAIPDLIKKIPTIIKEIVAGFKKNGDTFKQIGSDIVNGIWSGIQAMWSNLTTWFSSAWDGLVGGVKDLLGIHSPSRVFAEIGKNMALGVGEGWDGSFGKIRKDINGGLNFGEGSFSADGAMRGGVVVNQYIYSEKKTAASLMREARYQQERAVLFGV